MESSSFFNNLDKADINLANTFYKNNNSLHPKTDMDFWIVTQYKEKVVFENFLDLKYMLKMKR